MSLNSKLKAALQKVVKPGTKILTIAQACKKWPDSKSRAFTILNGGTGVYFMIDDWPEYHRNNPASKVVSSFDALKILPDGQIFKTKANIQLEHQMNALTFKQFGDHCIESIAKVKESTSFTDKEKKLILQKYEELLGFKTD